MLPPKIYGQVGSSSRKNKDDESIIFLFHLVIVINRHILKISSALLSFGQRLINRITYRLPTNYQQLANVQFKKISIPTPKKVNVNSKGERVSKSQNFRRRTNPKMHYIVNILFGLSCIGRMGNNPHTLDARGLLARQW